MLCGLGVPSLRSLWGAVRNRQLYILRMYCKGWISFNFSIFFIIYTTYSKKKKLHNLPQKLKNSIFFYNSRDLQQKKKLHAFTAKKNYTTIRFFCTRLTFFTEYLSSDGTSLCRLCFCICWVAFIIAPLCCLPVLASAVLVRLAIVWLLTIVFGLSASTGPIIYHHPLRRTSCGRSKCLHKTGYRVSDVLASL